MQMAAHEAYNLHELTVSCVNTITNMGLFLHSVKDSDLKNILEKHLPYHIKDYNTKVEYLSRLNGAKTGLPIPQISSVLESFVNPQIKTVPTAPRIDVQELDDREIATAYLLTLKRAGREYAWSAMEASNPEIRTFLEDAFRMSSHHAYDVWQWMVRKGYYPLESISTETMGVFSNMYNTIEEAELQ